MTRNVTGEIYKFSKNIIQKHKDWTSPLNSFVTCAEPVIGVTKCAKDTLHNLCDNLCTATGCNRSVRGSRENFEDGIETE